MLLKKKLTLRVVDVRLATLRVSFVLYLILGSVFVCHDVKDVLVCLCHGITSYACKVVDATVDIVIDDTFVAGDDLLLHGKEGREHR